MIVKGEYKPKSQDSAMVPGAGHRGRIAGLLAVVAAGLIVGFIAPAPSDADPGCPQDSFRDPATQTCEPYITHTEYGGEDAFLAESATLFAGSTGDDVLELGNSICRSLGRGTSPNEIAGKLISGGIDKTSAVTVVVNAQKLLC